MAVQKARWPSGKTKNASGSQNGRPDGENAGREAKNGAGKTRKAFGRPDARAGSVRAGSLTSEVRQGTVRRAVPLACRIQGRAQQGAVAQPQVMNRSLTQCWAGRVRTQRAVAAAPLSRYSSALSRRRRLSRCRVSFLGAFFMVPSSGSLPRADAARDILGIAGELERIGAQAGHGRRAAQTLELRISEVAEAFAVQGELPGVLLPHRVLPGQTVQL